MKVSALVALHISLLLLSKCQNCDATKKTSRHLQDDAVIFQNYGDGFAQGTQGTKIGTACCTDTRRVSFIEDNAEEDYMQIVTTKWHSGGYRMDCMDKGSHTGWQCWATCQPFPNPNFMDWGYLIFEAKAWGTFDSTCQPSIGITKRWPSYHSNTINLNGAYVDGGSLSESEWTTVVIPTSAFATEEWPTVNGVKDMYFRNCGTDYSVNPTYQVRGLKLTDTPPAIQAAPVTDPPTDSPTATPTTGQPTGVPSPAPSLAPTNDYWPVWETYADGHTLENPATTCFANQDRLGITSTAGDIDYFTVQTDPWAGGGLLFGCQKKDENYNCIESCFGWDGNGPDWSDKEYLTFLAKIDGDFTDTCQPAISFSGGGWPRHNSNKIQLEGLYVDQGYLVSDEWRRVLIPIADLKTVEWDMSNLYGMYFNPCGTEHSGAQPKYLIAAVAVTNTAVDLISLPPSSAPTEFVADDPLLATHRFYHTNWYPLVGADREPSGNVWYVAEDNTWPANSVSDASDYTATVHIPADQTVVYSQADTIVYDKIVVEGRLTIQPIDGDVSLTVGTILVEEGGVLDILTDVSNSFTVSIDIDGALDTIVDPEQQMLGIVSLGGSLTIEGNAVGGTMFKLVQPALAGQYNVELLNDGLGGNLKTGDEIILPDTQEGLPVGHWNFPINAGYEDQTESCIVSSIAASAETSTITCESILGFTHSAGSHAGHVTRSITVRTSPSSIDRAHILHTGVGKFHVKNARLEQLGRTTTKMIDSTVMSPSPYLKFDRDGLIQQMNVSHIGVNQIARYALHAHHSLVEGVFDGNAILFSPRDGCVAHNSRVHIVNNVVVGADGTGIFLEDGTETGPVTNNYIIGTGGGSRGGDDGRFAIQSGTDMAHGGFGIWCRGKLAPVKDNNCEGHFGVAPYAFFVHPNFISGKIVPDVPGTNPALAGKTLSEISSDLEGEGGLKLQSYGGFVGNTAVATFQVGIDLSYFSSHEDELVGSKIEDASIRNLAMDGRGISTTHSKIFTLVNVTIEGTVAGNTITGVWCNNCDSCTLETPEVNVQYNNVNVVRGGNC